MYRKQQKNNKKRNTVKLQWINFSSVYRPLSSSYFLHSILLLINVRKRSIILRKISFTLQFLIWKQKFFCICVFLFYFFLFNSTVHKHRHGLIKYYTCSRHHDDQYHTLVSKIKYFYYCCDLGYAHPLLLINADCTYVYVIGHVKL